MATQASPPGPPSDSDDALAASSEDVAGPLAEGPVDAEALVLAFASAFLAAFFWAAVEGEGVALARADGEDSGSARPDPFVPPVEPVPDVGRAAGFFVGCGAAARGVDGVTSGALRVFWPCQLHATQPPSGTRCEATPEDAYVHVPSPADHQSDQYADADEVSTQPALAGAPLTRHTKPGSLLAYCMPTPARSKRAAARSRPLPPTHVVVEPDPSCCESTTTVYPEPFVHAAACAAPGTATTPTAALRSAAVRVPTRRVAQVT